MRRPVVLLLSFVGFVWGTGVLAATASAQPRIPVSIESTPPGATVYVDSDSSAPIGTTPIRVARIPRGQHTLIFKLDNHETARLTVDVRRRRETFRAVLNPLSTLVVTPGNSAAQSAAVVIDGQPLGNVPFRQTLTPGRHLVQVRKDGHKTYEQWVQLEGGQVFTLPVMMEQEAPDTGSILVAGDVAGAPIYVDGEPRGVTPSVLEDVPAGEHRIEIRPQGKDPHTETVRVRAGERSTVTPQFRAAPADTGRLRVLTTPSGATVSIDGEVIGQSPATADEVAAGEHIVEAVKEGYQRAQQSVTVESGRQRVISLELPREELRPGRIVVNATVEGAQVTIDGEAKGGPPVVIENAPEGTHAIVVSAPGYEDFRHTCSVAPGRDCEVLARMEPVGTPVRVEANIRGAEFYVDDRLMGPVPWEGSVPVGAHRIEVRAEGHEPHIEQVQLRPQSEPRVFNVALVKQGEVAPEERAELMQDRLRVLREATSYSAATLPPQMTLIDVSAGWPYLLEARLGVGIIDWLEAGFAMRSMITRLTQFEGRVKAGWRPIEQIALGGQLRFGGGIGPARDATEAEKAAATADDPPGSHSTNNVFLSLEALFTLHFSHAGAFTLWGALDMYSDRWDWCGKNQDQFPQTDGSGCAAPDDPAGAEGPNFRPGRQKQARMRLGGALEIVINRRWNIWALLEGIIVDPDKSRRMYGDIFNVGGTDPEIYARLGFTYKFGRADQIDDPAAAAGAETGAAAQD